MPLVPLLFLITLLNIIKKKKKKKKKKADGEICSFDLTNENLKQMFHPETRIDGSGVVAHNTFRMIVSVSRYYDSQLNDLGLEAFSGNCVVTPNLDKKNTDPCRIGYNVDCQVFRKKKKFFCFLKFFFSFFFFFLKTFNNQQNNLFLLLLSLSLSLSLSLFSLKC